MFSIPAKLIASLAVCCIASGCKSASPMRAAGDDQVVKRCEKDRIILQASVPRRSEVGASVIVEIRLINKRNGAITFDASDYYNDCRIDVKHRDGRECPYTDFGRQPLEYGRQRLMARSPLYAMGIHRSRSIPKHDRHTWVFDLSQLFLLMPGEYLLFVSHEYVNGRNKYVVEPLEFKIWSTKPGGTGSPNAP